MKTYKTLKQLKTAIDSGKLRLTKHDALTIDNDSTYLYLGQEAEDGGTGRECVFSCHPAHLMEQALDLLGIPWENA